MSSKQLTAKVRLDAGQTERKLQNIAKAIDKINRAAGKQSNLFGKVTSELNKADKVVKKVEKSTKKVVIQTNTLFGKFASIGAKLREVLTTTVTWGNSQKGVNSSLTKSNSLLGHITKKLKLLASTYLGIMGMGAIISTSDTITKSENKLNALNGNNSVATQESMDKMYGAAQRSRTGYSDMMANVSKSMTLAGDAFQGNIDNAIRFQEIMGKTYALGGASAAEMSSSMYQMIQALGSGILQGDELRSVREGAPLAYKAIEEFAQGIYGADKNLKDLASDGLITSDIVVAAIMKMGEGADAIDAKFAQTAMTFEQAWTQIKNVATKAFEPTLQLLNDILNKVAASGMLDSLATAIQVVASASYFLLNIIGSIITAIADNWEWIKNVILVVAITIGVLLIPKLIMMLGALGLLSLKAMLWGTQMLIAGIKAAAALWGVSIPVLLVIALLVAMIAVVFFVADSFQDACGIIVGAIAAAGAFILNIFIGVINAILQFLWTFFVEPFIGIIEFILNAAMGGFDSFGGAVANLIGQIISWFLSLGTVVTKIIDAIFGTNWTSGLNSLQDSVLKWGKKEDAITVDRTIKGIDRINYGNAYDAGYNVGYAGGEWLDSKLGINSGINDIKATFGNLGKSLFNPSDLAVDPSADANAYDATKALEGIKGDTGSISDSLDLTQEDLEYLRRVADMEWKKEFTTAEIKIDMTNNNQVNGDGDLDGIVTRLADKLYEEMNVLANGVYA